MVAVSVESEGIDVPNGCFDGICVVLFELEIFQVGFLCKKVTSVEYDT